MLATTNRTSVEDLNRANAGKLPGHLGLEVTEVDDGLVVGRFQVRPDLVAHTGYLLAGTVLSGPTSSAPMASRPPGPRARPGSRPRR